MDRVQFGPFQYDSKQRLLFRDGQLIPLQPKVADTLQVLLDRKGQVVEKAELIKLLWPDTTVEEVGLARNISLLRKALETGDSAEYIETVPGRGYRFIAEVQSQQWGGAPAPPMRVPGGPRHYGSRWGIAIAAITLLAAAIYWQFYTPSRYLRGDGLPALAVVPFESAGPEGAAFARGVSDLLVADLSKLGGMSVLSPSTVRRHQKVGVSMGLMGRILGLQVLVEGTVQRVEDRMEVTARLVDVHTGRLIWADHYHMAPTEMNEASKQIAAQVAGHLAVESGFRK